jgi:hypothetical protein
MGADAEAAGDLEGARARYQEACDKRSKWCPLATRQAERLRVKEAWKAIAEGRYGRARSLLEDAKGKSKDPAVRGSAEAALRSTELTLGLAWEEASALPVQEEALAKIEALVDGGLPPALFASAKGWLDKNRPAILLGRVKAACSGSGTEGAAERSCMKAGKALARLYPEGSENAEAQALVQAETVRVYPLLKQAEGLLVQRVELYDKDRLVDLCVKKAVTPSEACASQVIGERHLPTPHFLDGVFQKALDAIRDGFYVKAFKERYWRAEHAGEYDPEKWVKPGGEK